MVTERIYNAIKMKLKRKSWLIIFGICVPVFILYAFLRKHVEESSMVKREPKNDFVRHCSNDHALSKPSIDCSHTFLRSLYSPKVNDKPKFLHLTDDGISEFAKNVQQDICPQNEIFMRQRKIRERCEFPIENKIDLSRMVYDDKHKVVLCVVPKAACTTWKSYMWYLLGKVDSKDEVKKISRKDLILFPNGPTPLLINLSYEDAIKRLLTYTTFFVTRHPFERLVSAYQSKFTMRYGQITPYMTKHGKGIAARQAAEHLKGLDYIKTSGEFKMVQNEAFDRLNKTAQNAALEYIAIMNTGNITFLQFVKHIVDDKRSTYEFDVHWRPQMTLCNPCVVNYDYVIRFEKLAEESNLLLEYMQRKDPEEKRIFFDTNRSPFVDSKRASNSFSQINEELLNKLKKIYIRDFITMDYALD